MALRDTVELDTTQALREIRQLGAALTQEAQRFRVEMARATQSVAQRRAVPPIDTAAVRRATTDMRNLEKATDATTAATGKYGRTLQAVAQVRVVQGLIAFFGGRALAGAINDAAEAASNLNEQMALAQTVFGDAAGQAREFADTASEIGLASDQALEFSNAFGNLLRNAGFGTAAAAQETEKLIRLGADLSAAFNLQSVEDGLTKLRAGLVGEVEPLRAIGAGFTAAEVQARALANGLAATAEELTQQDLIVTRLQLIYERTANAQDNFRQTQGDLAQQQKILRAEIRNLQIEVGQALLPVFLEFITEMRALAPEIAEIGKDLVPVLVNSFRVGLPIFVSAVDLLSALTPILTLLSEVISSIPTPLLNAATAFLLFGTGIGPLPNLLKQFAAGIGQARIEAQAMAATAQAQQTFFRQQGLYLATVPSAARSAAGAMTLFRTALAGVNPLVLGLTIALPVLTTVLSNHQRQQQETRQAVEELTAAFRDQSTSIDEDIAKQIADTFSATDLRRFGLTVEEITEILGRGTEGLREFRAAVDDAGGGRPVAGVSVTETDIAVKKLEKLKEALNDTAAEQAAYLVSLSRISEEELRASENRNRLANGVVDYLAVLREVSPATADAVIQTANLGDESEGTADAMESLDKAIKGVVDRLDILVGRFIDAEEATIGVRDAAREVAEALGEGAREGEGLASFQDRLRGLTLALVEAVQDETEALARNKEIAADAIPAVMVARLRELQQQFPEVAAQVQVFIDRLGGAAAAAAEGFTVQANVGPALEAIGQVQTAAEALEQGITVIVDADTRAARRNLEAFAFEMNEFNRAMGGIGADIVLPPFIDTENTGRRGADRQLPSITQAGRLEGESQRIERFLRAQQEASRALEEQLRAEREERERLINSVSAHISALRALKQIEDSRRAAQEAQKQAAKEAADVAAFDAAIANQRVLLARATAARQAAGLAEPSIEERRALNTLRDLETRRPQQVQEQVDAETDLRLAQLDVIDAQLRLVEAGQDVIDQQGALTGFFQAVASQAGLSTEAVNFLTASLQQAADAAVGANAAFFAQDTGFVSPSPLGFTSSGNAASGGGGGGGGFAFAPQPAVIINEMNIIGTGDPFQTAQATVAELQLVALGAAG